MLNLVIFLPLLTGFVVLALPRRRPDLVRRIAFAGAGLTLIAAIVLWIGFDPNGGNLQWRMTTSWIPA